MFSGDLLEALEIQLRDTGAFNKRKQLDNGKSAVGRSSLISQLISKGSTRQGGLSIPSIGGLQMRVLTP